MLHVLCCAHIVQLSGVLYPTLFGGGGLCLFTHVVQYYTDCVIDREEECMSGMIY